MSSVEPYSFEPLKKELNRIEKSLKKKVKVRSDEELVDLCSGEKRKDADVSRWCKCKHCKRMETSRECLCCTEIDEIKYKKLSGNEMLFFLRLKNY